MHSVLFIFLILMKQGSLTLVQPGTHSFGIILYGEMNSVLFTFLDFNETREFDPNTAMLIFFFFFI